MRSGAQVVVVGGGVVGASVLYHLTKAGWTDVVLVERTELTAGSTWHSAGGMHTLNSDPNVARLQRYTIELYAEIERISGQDCGVHMPGGVMLADTPERLDWLKMTHARGRYLGMETELVSVAEAAELVPLIDPQHFVGALVDAHEGHVDPAGVTHAFARAARAAGAEVYRNCWARAIERRRDGGWRVLVYDTASGEDLGAIDCEHVVNCGGLWAREVGRMVGLELPVLAMEHTYIVTEPLEEVIEYNRRTGSRLRHVIDFGGEMYMRQEGEGMLLGTYEQACLPWSPRQTPWDFSMRLLPSDLDRIADSLEVAFAHFPAFAAAGIQRVVNGPFTFAPDGNPLVGPVRGLPGYWTACGVMAGLSQCGGVGLSVANWITAEDPGFDVWAMDVARFGDYATLAYTNAKVRENYTRRFRITFPNEFLPEGRGVQTSPIYDRLVAANAVWGDAFGLESALWFQEEGLEPVEEVTFGRSNAWDRVRAETLSVRAGVGMMETTGFAKFLVEGPGAREWLDRLLAGRIPIPGRMALTPMTNPAGSLVGDLTVACLPAGPGRAEGPAGTVVGGATGNVRDGERFVVFGSGIAERYYERWFDAHLPTDSSVSYQTLGAEMCGLAIAGPAARDLLAEVTDTDVSAHGMRFMAFGEMEVGLAPVWCGRISFTGDLGYELWMPARYQRYVFDLLRSAGEAHGLELFGLHALNSLRLEKGFGSWLREYRPDYDPFEAGLGRFVRMEKDFVGRDALVAKYGESGPPGRVAATGLRLCTWTVDVGTGPDAYDVIGDEPVWHDGEVVGWVTSGGYAHHSEASVAMGYVPAELAGSSGQFEIEIVGTRRPAKPVGSCLWDPAGDRMRS
ncbi:MAG: FAD-dependent oxidoreductase [Acidimicrobiaceae bacterium]|nr:FAD-dependent oxidoreductase [Acidimicrobiaceae bacterium]MYB85893.1 FAD-dependent oxidoreductase [Acidimicrobiaceae bacterium]MYH93602.1 FAD-dependent oxidoreductase [Acidimicrobiaceae bacterium]